MDLQVRKRSGNRYKLAVVVHPWASVTLNDQVPGPLVKLPVPVYGAVPPDAFTVTVVEVPLQGMTGAVAVADKTVWLRNISKDNSETTIGI